MGQEPVPDPELLAMLTALYREFPRWAVWLPPPGGQWTAVRPAGSRPPGPQMPTLWAQADTTVELADRMRRSEEALRGF